MDSKPNKSEVEAKLHQTADAMSSRMASLREEVATTGTSVRDWVVANPVKSVGGMLAAGLAVGMLFGGSRRKRRRAHARLIDQYVDALSDELDDARRRGDEPGKALEKALRDRVPLVVYTGENASGGSRDRGFVANLLGESFEILFRTGLSLLARDVIEAVLANANVEDMMDDDLLDQIG